MPAPSNPTTLQIAGDVAGTIDPACAASILNSLREELDRIDTKLLETLRERLDCCCRIGLHKRDHSIPMMQPQRIGVVQQRAASFAKTHAISPAFLQTLYDLIITETCRLEDEIIDPARTAG